MRPCCFIYAVCSGGSVIGRLRKVELSEILICAAGSGVEILFPVEQ